MKTLIAAALLLPGSALAAERLPVKACVKWSQELPQAQMAGVGLFSDIARVEGEGPFPSCDVVIQTENFGVGWLMRAWMKEGVYSPCGERLGGFKFAYRGEEWRTKIVTGLHAFLSKRPKALSEAKPCAK